MSSVFVAEVVTPSESEKNKNFTDSKPFHAEFVWINCINRDIVEFATNVRKILNLKFNLKNRNWIIWMGWDGHEEKVADTGELEQCSSSTDVGWDRSGDLCTGSARPAPTCANRARQAASLSGHQMCWFECANLNTRLLGYLFALQTKII